MCDRAALLPADLISPEGGGGAGLNENLSKVLKYMIAGWNGTCLHFSLVRVVFLAVLNKPAEFELPFSQCQVVLIRFVTM